MKLSCLPVSIFSDIINGTMTLKEWAAYAKELKLDAVDLSVLLVKNRTPVCVAAAAEALKSEGVDVCMITTYPDFTHPDAAQRERELAHALSDIALASSLGAKYIRLTAGQVYDWEDEDKALDIAVEYLLRAKKFADEMGVGILFENHSKPGAWEKPDALFDTGRFLKFAEKLKGTGIGINFDTANTLAYGDDAVEVFKKVFDQVVTFHINDCDAKGSLKFVVAGTGAAPIQEILEYAKKNGWNGWVCIEEAGFQGLPGIKQAVDYVNNAWNSID